eukprot:m.301959 g.301959  ORF g.301959 m.301959 type:complete len:538 (-) comp14977_c0_seq1:426-2039(-)
MVRLGTSSSRSSIRSLKRSASTSSARSTRSNADEEPGNFWDVGAYKRVTKRIDDGLSLLDDYQTLVRERAMIEHKYASMLRAWSKRWDHKIEKGSEDTAGTLRPAWFALLREADSTADVHEMVREELTENVAGEVSRWKKEHYSKSMVKGVKETRKAEDAFHKAQKPWAHLLHKMDKAERIYHSNSKSLESAQAKLNQLKASGDSTPEEQTKLSEKISKIQVDVHSSRQTYKDRLQALHADERRYVQDMQAEFINCQDFEQQRIDFLKRAMKKFHDSVDVSKKFTNQWEILLEKLEDINSDSDLVCYQQRAGVGMPLLLPQYREHNEPIHFDTKIVVETPSTEALPAATSSDAEWDEEDDAAFAPPPPETTAPPLGMRVQALYDYQAEEAEEISFAAGDIITQIEEEDEQGWCKGIHPNGSIGLYPANYVAVIDSDGFYDDESNMDYAEEVTFNHNTQGAADAVSPAADEQQQQEQQRQDEQYDQQRDQQYDQQYDDDEVYGHAQQPDDAQLQGAGGINFDDFYDDDVEVDVEESTG